MTTETFAVQVDDAHRAHMANCRHPERRVFGVFGDLDATALLEHGVPLRPLSLDSQLPAELRDVRLTGKLGKCHTCGALIVELRLVDYERHDRPDRPLFPEVSWTVPWTAAVFDGRTPRDA